MPKAYILKQTGDAEFLKQEEVEEPKSPGPNQVIIKHTAIGLNYRDIDYRKGIIKAPLPMTPGTEAVGIVEAVGEGVSIKTGTRVAYATSKFGSYSEKRLIDINLLVGIPDSIGDKVVAAGLAKGLTAHYLLYRTFSVKENDFVLVLDASGGTGQLICQWANNLGAKVIGVVESEELLGSARNNGCIETIISSKEDFSQAVAKITNGVGVSVVYDCVGKNSFVKSIKSLKYMGLLVCYGQTSGPVPPFSILNLYQKGIFVTCPALHLYKANRMELVLSSVELFNRIESNELKVKINKIYSFDQIPQAHKDMENSSLSDGANIVVL